MLNNLNVIPLKQTIVDFLGVWNIGVTTTTTSFYYHILLSIQLTNEGIFVQ